MGNENEEGEKCYCDPCVADGWLLDCNVWRYMIWTAAATMRRGWWGISLSRSVSDAISDVGSVQMGCEQEQRTALLAEEGCVAPLFSCAAPKDAQGWNAVGLT